MIVVDASVLVNALADDDEAGHRARAVLRAHAGFVAPDLVDVEAAAVLRRRWLAGAMDDERFEHAVDDLVDMPFERFPTRALLQRVFELRANISAYDACYVAVAEALDWPLVTADRRLARAPGPRCAVQVLEDPAST